MASTYSPSLRIELIGAGEQAGTWNTTTNSNLGTIIESAIAGYVAVSVTSANQAFTASDGAADQARNAVIALSTTTGANFAVYAPPQEKQYIIYNTTAFTATIYNSTTLGNTTAAGLGVAVSAGVKTVVFSDGTNFYSTSAPDLTGAITSVGSATSLGSFTSTQLRSALTDETGTGVAVFATSPTLVTPILGTPTSGVMTNVTGLPIDGGTVGTLPVARGGTGVTASTGTGSVVLSNSPTLVTPALGTPSALVGTNITGTAAGLSIGGNAATATITTNATNATNANPTVSAGSLYVPNNGLFSLGTAISTSMQTLAEARVFLVGAVNLKIVVTNGNNGAETSNTIFVQAFVNGSASGSEVSSGVLATNTSATLTMSNVSVSKGDIVSIQVRASGTNFTFIGNNPSYGVSTNLSFPVMSSFIETRLGSL